MKAFLVFLASAFLFVNVASASDTQFDMLSFCTKAQVPAGIETYVPPTSGFSAYIISIRSVFIDMYMNGGKSFEYRKSFPCESVTHVIFYDSESKNVVATGKVVQGLKGTPAKIIDATVDRSGVSKTDLWWYYQTTPVAYATEVKFELLPRKITLAELKEMEPTFAAPQGYTYLKKYPKLEEEIKKQLAIP
ncbi:hypothetical protein D3C87_1575820 [compost metagenome]